MMCSNFRGNLTELINQSKIEEEAIQNALMYSDKLDTIPADFFYNICNFDREIDGISSEGCCDGLFGAKKVSEICEDCPFWIENWRKRGDLC